MRRLIVWTLLAVGTCSCLEVTPSSAEVPVGESVQFSSSTPDVTWEVEEGLVAGSIDATGLYTAPPSAGLVHVIARAGLASARVPVTVRERRLVVLAGKPGGPATAPVDGIGSGARLALASSARFVDGFLFFIDSPLASTPVVVESQVRRLELATQRLDTPIPTDRFRGRVDGTPGVANFESPSLIGHSVPGRLVLLDLGCVRELDVGSMTVSTLFCDGFGNSIVSGIAADAQWVYATASDHVFLRRSRDGNETSVLAGRTAVAGRFEERLLSFPIGLELEGRSLLFLDQSGTAVRRWDMDAAFLSTVPVPSAGAAFAQVLPLPNGTAALGPWVFMTVDGRVRLPSGPTSALDVSSIQLDGAGGLLMTGGGAVRRHDLASGQQEVLAGAPIVPRGNADGVGEAARFDFSAPPVMAAFADSVFVAERPSSTIREITRGGVVTTRFRGIDASSLALDATHVYAVSAGRVQRARRTGGPWEPLPNVPFTAPVLVGRLDDGQLVAAEGDSLWFIDPVRFQPTGRLFTGLAALIGRSFDESTMSLDPRGRLIALTESGLVEVDFSTRAVTLLSPARLFPREVSFGSSLRPFFVPGRGISAVSRGAFVTADPLVFKLDVSTGQWLADVGRPRLGSVLPGPLSRALVHEPSCLTGFASGELVIADSAEHVLLVVE
jgi:hypothetical protein